SDRGRRERRLRGMQLFCRGFFADARDRQRELFVQTFLHVGTAGLGAPAQADDVLEILYLDVAVEGNVIVGIRGVMRFVRPGGESQGAGEATQAVRLAACVGG